MRGTWKQGDQLPTERDLADQLGISRNTVSAAYRQLEAQGIVSRRQGAGTFVCFSPNISVIDAGDKDQVLKLVDLAIGEALELGFSIEDFTAIVALRVRQKKEMLNRLQVAFIECNREQLDYFTKELELGSGVTIHPLLLQDLQQKTAENLRKLRRMDMVVTTFYHLDEIKAALGSEAPQLLGIALEPSVNSIVKIARATPDSRIPVVCLSKTFAESIVNVLQQLDITFENMPLITTRDQTELSQALAGASLVVASPNRKKDVEQAVDPGTEIIEFVFRPDTGSITSLKAALLGVKNEVSSSAEV